MALTFPHDISRRPGYIRFKSLKHDGGPTGGEQIELPLPPTIVLNDAVTYENFDREMTGQALAAAAGGNLDTLAKEYGVRYTNNEDGSVDYGQLASDIVAKIGVNSTRLEKGKAPNPDTRSMFKQPNLRTMGFTFKLIATSPQDPRKIRDIIKEFRTRMYPTKDGEGPDIFYKFPDKFDIRMYLGDKAIAPKFHHMYLTQVNVTFGGAVLASNDANHWFAETDLQLNFTESKTLVQKDIVGGF